tara:strand:- start:355 stop:651 length:297 start_codon:yes stop_codon:yes gene_type:complete
MRITERDLRRVIKNVISETSMDMMQDNMEKANKCCSMSMDELLDMCRQICAKNMTMANVCCELCYCASKRDVQGCCKCLDKICSCSACAQICSDFCRC